MIQGVASDRILQHNLLLFAFMGLQVDYEYIIDSFQHFLGNIIMLNSLHCKGGLCKVVLYLI